MNRFTSVRMGVLFAGICLLESSSMADVNPPVFRSVLELGQSGMGTSVFGGKPASSKDFPASFFYTLTKDDHCTATVIGPLTVLTAAHCVREISGLRIALGLGSETFKATCRISSLYTPSDNSYNFPTRNARDEKNTSADFALCLLEKKIANIKYEKIATAAQSDKVGEKLLVSGFGCAGFADVPRKDYQFRTGETTTSFVPGGYSYYIVADGDSVVCPGDSGGATYRVFGAGARVLAGVNSRTNQLQTSYISSVSSSAANAFFLEWEISHPKSICGRGSSDAGCK